VGSITASRAQSHVDEPVRGRARPARVVGLLVCFAIVVFLIVAGLSIGSRAIPMSTVWHVLLFPDSSRESIVVWQLRMPRTALGVVVGSALALAGVVMQALTRNPLAEPGILGVNSGAAVAVVVAISAFGVADVAGYVWFAFGGAILAAGLAYLVGGRGPGGQRGQVRLVLAGAALSASLGACTGIITMVDSATFDSYRFWVVGALADRGLDVLAGVGPFVAAGALLALFLGPRLNALALGDDLGAALGLRVGHTRILGFIAVMLLCGSATAAAGPIAFVGLVVPHVLRLLIGGDLRWLLAYAIPAGPILVLASDIVGRIVAPPAELEVGIVTAFLGAPVLLQLILRRRVSA
jgi:iron complex transport system permease protein